MQALEALILLIMKNTRQDIFALKASLPETISALLSRIDLLHKALTESEDQSHVMVQRLQQSRTELLERMSHMVPRQDLLAAREDAKSSLENAELLSHQAAKQREAVGSLSDRLSLLQEQHDNLELRIKVKAPVLSCLFNSTSSASNDSPLITIQPNTICISPISVGEQNTMVTTLQLMSVIERSYLC